MKIIKPGAIPVMEKIFSCDYCGCKFSAEEGEYEGTSQWGVMHDGLGRYHCVCPTCGRTVYSD